MTSSFTGALPHHRLRVTREATSLITLVGMFLLVCCALRCGTKAPPTHLLVQLFKDYDRELKSAWLPQVTDSIHIDSAGLYDAEGKCWPYWFSTYKHWEGQEGVQMVFHYSVKVNRDGSGKWNVQLVKCEFSTIGSDSSVLQGQIGPSSR